MFRQITTAFAVATLSSVVLAQTVCKPQVLELDQAAQKCLGVQGSATIAVCGEKAKLQLVSGSLSMDSVSTAGNIFRATDMISDDEMNFFSTTTIDMAGKVSVLRNQTDKRGHQIAKPSYCEGSFR